MCVVAAVAYGISHDQITARICVEYFTIGHPPVFDTDDPTLLGIGWGVIATWWVGLLLGVPLMVVARVGNRPQRTARSLIRPLARLLVIMSAGAAFAGIAGWLLAREDLVALHGSIAHRVPADRHSAFLAALWAHSASYVLGILGGLFIIVRVWHSRGQQQER